MNSRIARTTRILSALILVWVVAEGTAHAQGPCQSQPVYTAGPFSQVGTVQPGFPQPVQTATGFSVTGTFTILVPSPAPRSGTLLSWAVECPVPALTGVFTTTFLSGSSTPPSPFPTATYGNTFGVAESSVLGTPGSTSTIPLALVNGVDNPLWTSLTANSPAFTTTTPGTLHQRFDLDGVYLTGPLPGVWTITVPVITSLNSAGGGGGGGGGGVGAIPTLSPWALAGLTALVIGSAIMRMRRRQRGGGPSEPAASV